MAKTREQKEVIVSDLTEKLEAAKAMVFSNYHGLGVTEVNDLRDKLIDQGGDFTVVKNSLFKIALSNAKIEIDDAVLEGPLSVSFAMEDEVVAAKVTHEFAKDNEALEVTGGYLDASLLSKEEVENLAKLPSKQEMIAKTVGTIKAPLSGFVGALSGVNRNFVYVLKAIADQKA